MTRENAVNRNTPIPLYFQVSQAIEDEIKTGTFKPGDLFSTEEELQIRFQVSRSTIRKAIDDLKKRGWLTQQIGKGTFIGSYHLNKTKAHLLSLTEELVEKGIKPGTNYISITKELPSEEVASHLHYTDEVYVIKRIRTADDIPLVYIIQYVPGFLQVKEDEVGESLYEYLERTNGLLLDESLHVISAAAADNDMAAALEITEGEPVVTFKRVTFDQRGRAVIYESGVGKAGVYEYRLKVTR